MQMKIILVTRESLEIVTDEKSNVFAYGPYHCQIFRANLIYYGNSNPSTSHTHTGHLWKQNVNSCLILNLYESGRAKRLILFRAQHNIGFTQSTSVIILLGHICHSGNKYLDLF